MQRIRDAFATKLANLRTLFVQHGEEEERSVLPNAEHALGHDYSANLAFAMRARFDAQVSIGYRKYMSLESGTQEVRTAAA